MMHDFDKSVKITLCRKIYAPKKVRADYEIWTAAVAFPARQTCSIGERSGDLAGHVGRHIFEDIVGRVAQYVDEHYPVDKWHLGNLIAWVAQSALKYRHVSASCQSALKDH
ncbi:hypothetical protein TNCV_4059041 [Trichonephila clavipes]|nr:hypothetical protein TNCV_4059041 [Trichonephila clavipes]